MNDASMAYKPLFYGLLHVPFFFDIGNVETTMLARMIFGLVGLTVLMFVFAIAFEISGRRQTAAVAVLLLASTSFFVSQGFRLRSDLLSVALQLGSLFCALRAQRPSGPMKAWTGGAVGLSVLMFLATPKAVFLFAVNFAFVVSAFRGRTTRSVFFAMTVLPPALFAAFAAIFPFSFSEAARYFEGSFIEAPWRPAYFSLESFHYVLRFLAENVVFTGSVIAAFWTLMRGKAFPFRRPLAVATAVSLAVLIFHNERLPFFILSLLPMAAIFAATALCPRDKRAWPAIFIFVLAGQAIFFGRRFYEGAPNENQIAAMSSLESYLKSYPKAKYFDGMGALPRATQTFFFVEPSHPENRLAFQNFLRDHWLDLVFVGNRMFFYGDDLFGFLESKAYINVGGGIYARSRQHRTTALGTTGPIPVQDACAFLTGADPLFFYQGANFMEMAPLSSVQGLTKGGTKENIPARLTVAELFRRYDAIFVESASPIVACTAFAPLSFPKNRTFAQLFDFDREN